MAVERIWFQYAPKGGLDRSSRAQQGIGYGGIKISGLWQTTQEVSDTWREKSTVSDTWKEIQET